MNGQVLWMLKSEKILNELKNGKRFDERKFDEYRKIKITTDVSENADGAARVKLGDTEVICGTKMIVDKPYPDSPESGTMSCGVELLPLASPEFETGPPREEAIELSRVVDRGIRESKAIAFDKLCITPGEEVWMVFIDMYILNYDGNLFDACSLAGVKSLLGTRIPKFEDGKIVKGEYAGKLELARKPVLSTFAKIGNHIILDPNLPEEKSLEARMSIATTDGDLISAFQKGGQGSFTSSEVDQMIDTAMEKGKELRKLY